MIAAIDSSCLIVFAKADALELLGRIFQGVLVAPAVREEAIMQAPTAAERNALAIEVERRRFANAGPGKAILASLGRTHAVLGKGELETLALVASKKAHVAIIDDRIARQVARLEGIPVVGSLGILARAYRKGLISKAGLRSLLERLTSSGLWLAPDVLEAFWASLGGR